MSLDDSWLGELWQASTETLTTLTSITSLSLWSPAQSDISLDPLQSLPSLQKLQLSSRSFTIAGLPKHLTSLGLKQVQLCSTNSFTRDMCLKKLSIVSSSFVGHAILGNKLLEELEISESHVGLDDDDDDDAADLDYADISTGRGCFLCADLSCLKNLRVLKLRVASQCTRDGSDELSSEQLYFCYRLPLLEELRLESTRMPVCIADELTQLSRLTSLTVACAQSGYSSRGWLTIMPEWLSMASLQHVHLSHVILRCGNELLGLLSIKTLVSLRLTNCTTADQDVGELVAALMYGMGKHNPHVEVFFLDRRLTDLLDLDRTLPKAADDEWW